MIFNNSETSGPLLNGRILKMYSLEVYIKSFGGEKGGSSEPPRTPPAYGPAQYVHIEDSECWRLFSCRGLVAEHWWLKAELSWV